MADIRNVGLVGKALQTIGVIVLLVGSLWLVTHTIQREKYLTYLETGLKFQLNCGAQKQGLDL